MINKSMKYSYNDISIVPAVTSQISSRKQCDVFENGKLPLFTAPMSSVVDENNFHFFEENDINIILPRTVNLEIRKKFSFENKWAAYSLEEFESIFCVKLTLDTNIKVLVDVANGHMEKLFELVKISKKNNGDMISIMIGNIANPETYFDVCNCGADYVRIGIGSGSGCLTSSNTAIHYPMASLIEEIVSFKEKLIKLKEIDETTCTKIIADGGVRNYSDAIKALALGADYVMIGGLFSRLLESSAETFKTDSKGLVIDEVINQYDENIKNDLKNIKTESLSQYYKKFFGMSTKKAQKLCGKNELKTSEGIEKIYLVEHTISGWTENFKDYLKSAMSYTNSVDLNSFKKSEIILISNNTYNSVNK